VSGRTHGCTSSYVQPEKETPFEDEQAQAPKALEVQPA
jgi:hypothetical protein